MPEDLVETITLDNALTLELNDMSRVIAGDRWLVSLKARVQSPIATRYFDNHPEREKALETMNRVYGDKVIFENIREKHFVNQNEKESCLRELLNILKENLLSYLSHPEFAKRFVISKYQELKRKQPQLFQ